ncbi:MAG: glycosyltransferase [Halolamina sp.]
MRVLNLVPSANSNAYRGQVRALRDHGVNCATLAVPGAHVPGERSRSVADYLVHLARALRSGREFDLVHANQGVVAPAALALGRPTVVSLWGTDLYGSLGPVSRGCARLADATVVMSSAMADSLDVHCRVIPHGVDAARFRPTDRASARQSLGWGDGHHVLFPYAPERQVKDFPRAERVVDDVGDRIDGPVELQAVSDVPHDRMPTYVNAADALLVTSAHEGSPNAVKEALACGLPVVSTPVGDVPARLDGVAPSTTATTDSALADALADVLRGGERSNGRESIQELSQDRTARELAAVYREVLGG